MDPLVSVLVPTFNRSALLRRALGSVLGANVCELRTADFRQSFERRHGRRGRGICEARSARSIDLPSPPPTRRRCTTSATCSPRRRGNMPSCWPTTISFSTIATSNRECGFLNPSGVGLLVTDCVIGRPRREATHLAIAPITSGREFFFGFWRGRYHVPVISNLFDLELARRCEPWNDPNVLYADVELWLKMMTLTDVAYYRYPAVYYHFHGQNIVSTVSLAMHKENVRFIDNAARFAAPAFGDGGGAGMEEVDAGRILADRDRGRPSPSSLRDMADMRAAIGLEDEPLGWPRWVRSARYFVRLSQAGKSFSAQRILAAGVRRATN